jgi:octaprenyl-diphosphate synthase
VGADLREGKLTLPVIVSLKSASTEDRRWMTDLIQAESFSEADFHAFSKMLDKYGGIAQTRAKAADFISDAKTCLENFPPSPHKKLL